MKTSFICNEDNYGQRIGTYYSIELSDKDIDTDRFGMKRYKGHYLYEDEYQALLSCQN